MLQPPPAEPGMREEEVDTPALILDLDAFEANLDHMAGLAAAGWVTETKAPWGRDHHRWFERHFGHGIGVYAIGDDLPNPDNRVALDPIKRDADGIPVATMHYAPGENDRRMMNYMLDRLVDISKAAGAFEVRLQDYRDKDGVYRTPAWHMIGTCRMGSDPETSVVNKWQILAS